MNDFTEVRKRLLSFSMLYDFSLRVREASLFPVSGVRLEDTTSLNLPKKIQKGKKEGVRLYSYFPEVTRPLLERYLKLRTDRRPTTDRLIVSDGGERSQ